MNVILASNHSILNTYCMFARGKIPAAEAAAGPNMNRGWWRCRDCGSGQTMP
jgi:hypothetical protein